MNRGSALIHESRGREDTLTWKVLRSGREGWMHWAPLPPPYLFSRLQYQEQQLDSEMLIYIPVISTILLRENQAIDYWKGQ